MMNIHIITPCVRTENLKIIKDNLETVRGGKYDLTWHICFDSSKVENSVTKAFAFMNAKSDWIKIYEATTHYMPNPGKSQINFVLTHFAVGIFSGFIYVLDDDNLLPEDFLDYDYTEEFEVYIFPQQHKGEIIRDAGNLVRTRIDQGQIMWHSSLGVFYDLHYQGDGEFAEELRQFKYKSLEKPVVNYNAISH